MNTTVTDVAVTDVECQLGILKTRWRESGDGTSGTVLMLHSIGLDRLAFDPLRAALPDTWRIVSIDLPGHGGAAGTIGDGWNAWVDVVVQAVRLCRTERLHLLGHSMGGALAACAAALAPVSSLSLVATPPQGFAVFAERADDTRRRGVVAQVDETLPRWFGPDQAGVDADMLAYASSSLRSMSAEGLALAWAALATFQGYQDIANALPQTLLIAGEDDRSTPSAAMQEIANRLAPSRTRMDVIPVAGHMLPLTHARQIAPLLTAHWRAAQL